VKRYTLSTVLLVNQCYNIVLMSNTSSLHLMCITNDSGILDQGILTFVIQVY